MDDLIKRVAVALGLLIGTVALAWAGGETATYFVQSMRNPILTKCVYQATPGSVTTGDTENTQCDLKGNTRTILMSSDTTTAISSNSFADGASMGTGLSVRNVGMLFNSATYDRDFTCSSFAAISVTAGSTTQIIGLSGSTVIRVCAVVLSTSLTGTFTMVSGTGSNCATPANSTGAIPILTATPVVITGGNSAVYRGSAGGEFCIAAATGNVTGYVMYAQF